MITFLYALGSLAFHFVLGEPAPGAHRALDTLFQGIALNLILTWPVYALARADAAASPTAASASQRIHAVG